MLFFLIYILIYHEKRFLVTMQVKQDLLAFACWFDSQIFSCYHLLKRRHP